MTFNELINKHYVDLNESDKYILKYIVSNKSRVSTMRIDDLAEASNVSRTTILRLSKKLGFSGYSELKSFLKWELTRKQPTCSNKIDEIERSFKETLKILKEKDLTELCEAIYNAKRVFVYGTGNSQENLANELRRMFVFYDKFFYLISGARELEMASMHFTEEDLIIIISHGGENAEIKRVVPQIILRKATLVSVTQLEHNYLSSHADFSLYGYSANYLLDKGFNSSSTFFYFIIIEILFTQYTDYLQSVELISD